MSDKKLRGGHRAIESRLIEELRQLTSSTLLEENKIKSTVAELRSHKERILSYDEKIQVSLEAEELLSDMEESSKRNLLIEEIESVAEDCLERLKASTRIQNEVSSRNYGNVSLVGVKLPTLSLPKFKGNPLDWSHFWDIFNNAIHITKDIPDAQKFVYLTGQLEGEASDLLEGFTTTDANYKEAVTLLQETYGDPKRIIQSHLHAIFDLKGPNCCAEELSKFRSAYECHLRGLKVLNTKVDDAGFVFSALLLRKLPPRIRDNINRSARSNYWTLEEFRKAINEEIILLQAAEPDTKEIRNKSKFFISKRKDKKTSSKAEKSTVSNLNVSTNESHKPKITELNCRLCYAKHYIKD